MAKGAQTLRKELLAEGGRHPAARRLVGGAAAWGVVAAAERRARAARHGSWPQHGATRRA